DKTSLAPFHLKSNEKEETLAKNGPLKAKAKQADTKLACVEALKKVKTVQKDGKGAAAASDVTQRQTYSRAFHTEQAVKHRKMVAEAPKPPAAAQSFKSAPGMYKGKMVQSKIGSIWKSSASLDRIDHKRSAPKTESQRVGNAAKARSKSVADLPRHGTQKPAPPRLKSVVSRPAQVSKSAVISHPPAGFYSARAPARTVPATLTSTSSRNTTVAPTKGRGTQNSKPKIPVIDNKVNKPPVSSTLSQYRFTTETAEERRAKLAAWQASKGKTFKRPAMTATLPPKTRVSKPEADLKSQSHVEPQRAAQSKSEHSLEEHKPDSAAGNCADTQGAQLTTCNRTTAIMNTTLELLENSDVDLPVDPQDRMDDIVLNLCDALEAIVTPSRCSDGKFSCVTMIYECDAELEDDKPKTECIKEEVNAILQDVCEQLKVEQVKNEAEKSDDKVETDDAEEVESDEDDDVMETTPPMEDASVVKYSVKTTPYLQSVKKTIEGEAGTSRRKSNIKDLKFLTPVRRSCRIQRKSSHLPTMLVDHDPCVSSLAELVKLDDDPNAYIYRKNPALLEDLPDQTRLEDRQCREEWRK
uniref:Si:ch211-266i6.3 n=1 Tax=Seriola dumerili TaxID=41447 RepID=A0A3B4V8W6_SERDU